MRNSKGQFEPGYGGRPKGATNKVTQSLRANVQKRLLEDNYEKPLCEDIKKLDPKSRADLWTKLLEFALPKLNRTEISEPPTDLETLMRTYPGRTAKRIIELQAKTQNQKSA